MFEKPTHNGFGMGQSSVIHPYHSSAGLYRRQASSYTYSSTALQNLRSAPVVSNLAAIPSSVSVSVLLSGAGIILEYELRDRSREMKEIDLLHLCPE